MKKSLINFSMSFLISFILGVLISALLSLITTFTSMNSTVLTIISSISTSIVFFIFGFIFSIKQRKKGLLNVLICCLFYLIIYFIFKWDNLSSSPFYIILIRLTSIILGSIFGVNVISKNDQTN